jgi:quercetin dioxygenase-like cupin family protein
MKTVAIVAALLFSLGTACAADAHKVQVTPLARTSMTVTGQPIAVPDKPDVIVSMAVFPPGARLPEHRHPYPHYVYVLEGVLTVVNTDEGKSFEVKAGDFVVEMQDTWHYGVNNGTVPVKLPAIDQVPAGTTGNMIPRTP